MRPCVAFDGGFAFDGGSRSRAVTIAGWLWREYLLAPATGSTRNALTCIYAPVI
jgi:hypothetical protein